MAEPETVIGGTLRPDGTLVLDEQPRVRPGRVRVRVEAAPPEPTGGDIMAVLREIWARREAEGACHRTAEEIDEAISALRDEAEERLREIGELQGQGSGTQT
jgi:hypothetical protein